jgi:predicted DNA binding CopG/RHH family protein
MMRREYDFRGARPNPYANQLKQPITIRLDASTVSYFKQLASELDMPYQSLINSYLRDCAQAGRRPHLRWKAARSRVA